MASVEQAKDAVEAEHQHAAEMTAKALSAIDSVVALSSHTLTFVAVVLGVVGTIGAVDVYVGAREMARKVATRRVDAYISKPMRARRISAASLPMRSDSRSNKRSWWWFSREVE